MRSARVIARHALQILRGLAGLLAYPVRTRGRALLLAWTAGFLIVGQAGTARAGDGFIVAPNLGGSGQTLFEKFPSASNYSIPTFFDSSHKSVTNLIAEAGCSIANILANLIMWFVLTLMRGALTAMQWLLSLDLYHDQSAAIDSASSALNTAVFLPLLGVTLPIAGFAVYARARQSGGGSIGNDLSWLVATAILAMTIIAQPSQVLGIVDTARTAIATHAMSGYANAAGQQTSVTGYKNPAPDGTTSGAIRQITDGLWEVYGVEPWCYVAWESMDSCSKVGLDYITYSRNKPPAPGQPAKAGVWTTIGPQLQLHDGDVAPFGPDTDWVRGQDPGRLGAAVLFGISGVVAAACLLVFFFFGLMSLIGVIILIFLGAVILPAWPIPGAMRALGNRWLESLLGTFLQSVLITTLVGAVMVVGALFNASTATYGVFLVTVFNVIALGLGLRYRSQLEHMIGFGTGATGGSVMTSVVAARALGKLSRMGARVIGGAMRTGATVGAGVGRSTVGAAGTIGRTAGRAGTHVAQRGYATYQARLAPLATSTGKALRAGASDVGGLVRSDVDHFRGRGAPTAPPVPVPALARPEVRMPAPTGGRKPPPPPAAAPPIPVPAGAQPAAHVPASAGGRKPPLSPAAPVPLVHQPSPRMAAPGSARPTPPPPPPTAAPGARRPAQPARMATPPRATPPAPAKAPAPAGYYQMRPIGGDPK